MSFYTALSGLAASQTELSVLSNNIANVATTGFKQSDAQFSDIISSSPFQTSTVVGQGTRVLGIQQDFTQGGFENTGRSLDLAISGQGFFVTKGAASNSQLTYTRDGSFSANANGYIVDANGNYLQVLPTDSNGDVLASSLSSLQPARLPQTSGTASATQSVNLSVTLPSAATVPSQNAVYTAANPYAFSPSDPNSYNQSTTTTVYDSAGNAFPMTTYYVRQNVPSGTTTDTSWLAYSYIGGAQVSMDTTAANQPAPLALTFDQSGALTSPTGPITTGQVTPVGASGPIGFSMTYGSATAMASAPFAMTSFSQDGSPLAQLDNVTINSSGLVQASYSNGTTQTLGAVALATFSNPDGLNQLGNSEWAATGTSGQPVINAANAGGSGSIQSGALEQSNVDITSALVALIEAQQNFSANAKAIQTDEQMDPTIIQLQG